MDNTHSAFTCEIGVVFLACTKTVAHNSAESCVGLVCAAVSCAQADGVATKPSGGGLDCKGAAGAAKSAGGGGDCGNGGCGCDNNHGTAAAAGTRRAHRRRHHPPSASHTPTMAPATANPNHVSGTTTAATTTTGLPLSAGPSGERRGGGGVKRPGLPLGAAEAARAGAGSGGSRHGGQGDGCCHLDQEFEGMTLNSG